MSDAENNQAPAANAGNDTPPVAAPLDQQTATPEEVLAASIRATNYLPTEWSVAQVLAWDEAAKLTPEAPLKTEADNWVNDPTRGERKYVDWSTSELLDQIRGLLNPAELTDGATKALITTLRGRDVGIELAWSVAEAVAFIAQGVTPPRTAAGLWVKDEVRDTKKAEQWTEAELDAWAKGEIGHGVKATDKYLSSETRKRFLLDANNNTPVAEVKAKYLKKFEASEILGVDETEGLTSVNEQYIKSALAEYAKKVGPNTPVTDASGGKAQAKLDTVFQYVMGLEGQAFVAGMTVLRDFFTENRNGVFEQTYMFRFTDHNMGLPVAKVKRHKDFLELLQVATHENPQLINQLDIRVFLVEQTDRNAERLLDYFKNYANA